MSKPVDYVFKIHPVSRTRKFTEFHKFVQRLATRHGSCRVTPCITTEDGSVRFEFGPGFGPGLGPAKRKKLKDMAEEYWLREGGGIGISNKALMLDPAVLEGISVESEKLVISLKTVKGMMAPSLTGHVFPLDETVWMDKGKLVVNLASPKAIVVKGGVLVIDLETPEAKRARNAANIRHDQHGGYREKQDEIRKQWFSGKYTSRDHCAEQKHAALGISFSTARKALRNMPEPFCQSVLD